MRALICDACRQPVNPRKAIAGYRITGKIYDGYRDEAPAPSHGGVVHPCCLDDAPPDVPEPEESLETALCYDREN